MQANDCRTHSRQAIALHLRNSSRRYILKKNGVKSSGQSALLYPVIPKRFRSSWSYMAQRELVNRPS